MRGSRPKREARDSSVSESVGPKQGRAEVVERRTRHRVIDLRALASGRPESLGGLHDLGEVMPGLPSRFDRSVERDRDANRDRLFRRRLVPVGRASIKLPARKYTLLNDNTVRRLI